MKLTIRLLSVLILMLLASPIILLKGCGKAVNSGACGGCPDTTAPTGSKFNSPTLATYSLSPTGAVCYPIVNFQLVDEGGAPLNNICVEMYTNGAMALHSQFNTDCSSHAALDYFSYIRTRTDSNGVISVDLLVSSPCSGLGLSTGTASTSYFVRAVSCSVSASATASITISPACP